MKKISTSPAAQLPDDFLWGQTVGLLLDALQIENLLSSLYRWSPALEVSLLYHGTQWAEVSRLSPCLVRVHDNDDPVLLQFLANTQARWGYLLVSDGSWEELLSHMRWLTSFHPPRDEEMFLRISDPEVAQALFAAEHNPGVEVFGPCQQIVVANTALGGWTQFKRPGEKNIPSYGAALVADYAQWTALQTVAFRKSTSDLYQHMQRSFPDYRADLTPVQRCEHFHQLACTAIDKGFTREQEIWLYANIFGFIGDEALAQHEDIFTLLTVPSELTGLQRVERAAALAAQRTQA